MIQAKENTDTFVHTTVQSCSFHARAASSDSVSINLRHPHPNPFLRLNISPRARFECDPASHAERTCVPVSRAYEAPETAARARLDSAVHTDPAPRAAASSHPLALPGHIARIRLQDRSRSQCLAMAGNILDQSRLRLGFGSGDITRSTTLRPDGRFSFSRSVRWCMVLR